MTANPDPWRIFCHPLFADRLADLERRAQRQLDRGRTGTQHQKLLAAVDRVMWEVVPSDPSSQRFRQGSTLGAQHRYWRRAKFLGRFRLFFRYNQERRVIVYAWMSDEESQRSAGSKSDPYTIFRKG